MRVPFCLVDRDIDNHDSPLQQGHFRVTTPLTPDTRLQNQGLNGKRVPGERISSRVDPFEAYVEYARIRLSDDPHLWATTLFDEVVALGYAGSYPSFTRGLRARSLRPHCEACRASKGRDHSIIDHPAGAETQWDWLELPDPPSWWGWGAEAHLLVGSLSHSSRWRAVLAESEDQPHLVEALDGVVRRLGGCTRQWRFDRMATVCHPATGRISATFGPVLSVASADDDGVVVGGDGLRAESGPAER